MTLRQGRELYYGMLPSQHHLHHPRARAKAQKRLRGMALFSAGALGVLGVLLMLYKHAAGLPALSIKDMPQLHQDADSVPTSYGTPQPTFRPGTLWLDDNDKPIQVMLLLGGPLRARALSIQFDPP